MRQHILQSIMREMSVDFKLIASQLRSSRLGLEAIQSLIDGVLIDDCQ